MHEEIQYPVMPLAGVHDLIILIEVEIVPRCRVKGLVVRLTTSGQRVSSGGTSGSPQEDEIG